MVALETNVEKKARRLLEARYLPRAQTVDPESLNKGLQKKMERIEHSDAVSLTRLKEIVTEAREIWNHRDMLEKKHYLYLAAGLAYFISPLDAIPDVIPGLGYVDDIAVLAWIITMIADAWRQVKQRIRDAIDCEKEKFFQDAKEHLGDFLDQRLGDIESSAQLVVQRTVSSIVLGTWGATTIAAISLILRVLVGTTPLEWLTYTGITAGLVLAWNAAAMIDYYRQFRALDHKWQRRILAIAANHVALYHVVAVGVPVLLLLCLFAIRVLWSGH